jgi:hypothetical protein
MNTVSTADVVIDPISGFDLGVESFGIAGCALRRPRTGKLPGLFHSLVAARKDIDFVAGIVITHQCPRLPW